MNAVKNTKIMAKDKRKWQTKQALWKLPLVLVADDMSFTYTQGEGITVEATEEYIDNLKERLTTCYGVAIAPEFIPINQ